MRRLPLLAAVAGVIGVVVVLVVELRSGPAPAPEIPAATQPPKLETTAPPLPPEIGRRRPPLETRPPEQAVRPDVESSIAPGESGDAAEAVRQASDAYAHESYREALGHAETALEIDSSSALARSLAVLSACGLGRGDRAAEHAARLDERRRQPLVTRCQVEYGVELEMP